jgi:hypothetical protein
MTAALVMTAALAFGQVAQQQQQQQAPPPPPVPAAQKAEAPKPVMFTGCVIAAPDREDHFQLVPATPDAARPIGTSGTSPAWTVPAYLLLGGNISAEHLSKTVEVTGTIDPAPAPAAADPKRTGDTTSRTEPPPAAVAQLHVQTVKIVNATCTPRKDAK